MSNKALKFFPLQGPHTQRSLYINIIIFSAMSPIVVKVSDT